MRKAFCERDFCERGFCEKGFCEKGFWDPGVWGSGFGKTWHRWQNPIPGRAKKSIYKRCPRRSFGDLFGGSWGGGACEPGHM